MRIGYCVRAFAVLAALLFLPGIGAAETAAEFYSGKVLKLVVGYGPGGGYDSYARLLAPHLEQRLGATVVVENRPGGGGMVAISRLASGPADGLTMVLANLEAATLGQLLDSPGIRFDVLQLPVVARVAGEPKVLLLSSQSPFRTVADLRAAERAIKWSAGGKTDSIADNVAVLSQALGLHSEIIIGYKGAKEAALAAIRGETDGLAVSAGTAGRLSAKGDLRAIAVLDRERAALLPDVPTIFELADLSEEAAWWIDFRARLTGLGRALIAAPGVPQDRLDFLRAAAEGVLTDPAVIAEAAQKKRPLAFVPHRGVEELIAQAVSGVRPETLERLREVILNKYY